MTAPKAKHRVPDVVKLVREYYSKPGNEVGGKLHIVFDDNNLGDEAIWWCKREAAAVKDIDGENLALVLLECSKSQRRRIAREAT